MNIVALVVALILIGAALYIIELLPIDATFKRIIRVVVIVVGLLYVLGALFGGIALLALVLPVAKVYLEEWRERKRRKLP
jgi:hypothetical protein